jgi:hypothetical protein
LTTHLRSIKGEDLISVAANLDANLQAVDIHPVFGNVHYVGDTDYKEATEQQKEQISAELLSFARIVERALQSSYVVNIERHPGSVPEISFPFLSTFLSKAL